MRPQEEHAAFSSTKDYVAYYDLGSYSRTITTTNGEAQDWFNDGLIWSFGFNHEESAICFQRAIDADGDCVMAYWGLAYALGPNYNKPWEAFEESELGSAIKRTHEAIDEAKRRSSIASGVENALVKALGFRYPATQVEADSQFSIWNQEYADAMKGVYEQFPNDLDVATFYADALMNLKPWGLWDLKSGEPAEGAKTLEIRTILENAIKSPNGSSHPGLLHLYIHLMEMSSTPESALTVSNNLLDLIPDSGHLRHMPSHIYILCGDYKTAMKSNLAAVTADEKFLVKSGNLNFYSLYRCHDYHFLIYAAMFAGQSKVALEAVDALERTIPKELLRVESPPMADWLESFISIRVHILIRFGLWDQLITLCVPKDTDLYCVTTAMTHYGHGIGYAAQGNISSAEESQILFVDALKRVKSSRTLFNNTCLDILAIAREMLAGEIAYRKGNFVEAFKFLKEACSLEDGLPYDEPWGWMQPTRHALAALSLEQNLVKEACAIYKADLGLDETLPRAQRHLNNVWALHGYHECLVRLGGNEKEVGEVKEKLDEALKGADVDIRASCYCRLGR